MKYNLKLTILALILSVFSHLPATALIAEEPGAWHLPTTFNDQNATVTFKLDSTWHTVHGTTSGVEGKAWLEDPKNPSSVNATIKVPVANFNTDNESRDEELRDIMNEKEFPHVIFTTKGLNGTCTPEITIKDGLCHDSLRSELKIRNVIKQIDVPVSISHHADGFKITGSTPVTWAEFNVEDPSIFLIASVDPIVNINFEVIIK